MSDPVAPMTEEQPRRLSAVMFTDGVGYTAIMQEEPPESFGSVTGKRWKLRSPRTGENSFSTSATGVSARSQVP